MKLSNLTVILLKSIKKIVIPNFKIVFLFISFGTSEHSRRGLNWHIHLMTPEGWVFLRQLISRLLVGKHSIFFKILTGSFLQSSFQSLKSNAAESRNRWTHRMKYPWVNFIILSSDSFEDRDIKRYSRKQRIEDQVSRWEWLFGKKGIVRLRISQFNNGLTCFNKQIHERISSYAYARTTCNRK